MLGILGILGDYKENKDTISTRLGRPLGSRRSPIELHH